mgnify:CR=1 FL=1
MVLDTLTNLPSYNALNSHFAKVCAYLKEAHLSGLPEGRYPIDGDNAYLMISERDLKKPADAALEVHDRYIDIQIVLSTYFTLGEGEIGIFFPQDAHAPLVGDGRVKKAVVKVKVE